MTWRNRVVEYALVPPDQLTAHPQNARWHPNRQRDVMRAVLDEVGWVAPVIENVTTGYVVDGHLRLEEALSVGMARIPVIRVELSPEEEAEALVTFDGVGQLARWEQERLDDLLTDVHTDSTVIDELLQDLAKTAVDLEPEKLPEPDVADDLDPEFRSLCAVYPREQFRDVVEQLRSVPGDSVGQKIVWLLARRT